MRGGVFWRGAVIAGLMAGPAAGTARAVDLMDLYAKASQFDPVFQAARYERQIADQSLREARAGLKPTLSANAQSSKVFQNITQSDNFLYQVGRTDYYTQSYGLTLSQPIFQPEALNRLPQARLEVRQAEARFAAAEQDLIFRLAQAHFAYLAARDNLEFATTERTAIWRQLVESEERLGSGLAKLTDVHEARARFALAQAAEIDADDALEESRQALAEITGEAPEELSRLSEAFPMAGPDRPDSQSWVEAAAFQNPTIVALQAAAEIADREVGRQRAAYQPRLDLVASYDNANSGGSTLGGGGGNEVRSTNLGLRLAIPIMDGGRASATVQAASLRHQMALQELEKTRRRVERETRAAFQGVVSGMTRVQALTQSVFSQESALSAREEGLRSGVSTGLDVLNARRDLFFARRDLAQARYLYILNGFKLKQSAGILYAEDLRQINAYLQ